MMRTGTIDFKNKPDFSTTLRCARNDKEYYPALEMTKGDALCSKGQNGDAQRSKEHKEQSCTRKNKMPCCHSDRSHGASRDEVEESGFG